jgi:DNA excision repair protein ERCC-4
MNLTILVDSREQAPLAFPGFETERATLTTADYSCIADGVDMRDIVAIERKSVSDLLACVGGQRERFEKELERLSRIRFRCLVIEASLSDVVAGCAGRRLTPNQVTGSVLAWVFKYNCPPIFAGDRHSAAVVVATLLRHASRYELAARTGCGIAGPGE